MAGLVRAIMTAAGAAVLLAAPAAQAEAVRSDQAALAQIAEVAVLQLCTAYVTGTSSPPAAFAPDLAQDVYDLQPGQFELGRFGKINTATGDLRMAVFLKERVCRVAVGDTPVDAVKSQLVAAMSAADSGWKQIGSQDQKGAWTMAFAASSATDAGAAPLKVAINGFDGPKDGGRGRQLWVTVGPVLVD